MSQDKAGLTLQLVNAVGMHSHRAGYQPVAVDGRYMMTGRVPRVGLYRAGFKCVEALGRIIIRGPYPPSNAIIYMHLQL